MALAAVHLYRAAGGTWPGSTPTELAAKVVGDNAPPPPAAASVAVAVALLAAGAIVAGRAISAIAFGPSWAYSVGTWVVAAVMALRALGGFAVSGLMRGAPRTPYHANDVRLYSPLTALLAAGAGLVAAISPAP